MKKNTQKRPIKLLTNIIIMIKNVMYSEAQSMHLINMF